MTVINRCYYLGINTENVLLVGVNCALLQTTKVVCDVSHCENLVPEMNCNCRVGR